MKAIAIFSAAVMFPLAVSAQSVTPSPKQAPQTSVDFSNAKPMPLPQARTRPMPSDSQAAPKGPPGFAPGGVGSGVPNPQSLPAGKQVQSEAIPIPFEAGTSNHPFTTSWANALSDPTFNHYPFSAAGKLFFKIGTDSFVCSASLIKPGVVVTAAHCVAAFGQRRFYSNWVFVPAYWNGSAAFGVWPASWAIVLTSYYDGSDPCA